MSLHEDPMMTEEEPYEYVTLDQYLPKEIKMMIFEFLPVQSLFMVAHQVCKDWHQLLCTEKNKFIWFRLLSNILKTKLMIINDDGKKITKQQEMIQFLSCKQWRKLLKFITLKERSIIKNYLHLQQEKKTESEKTTRLTQPEDPPSDDEDEEWNDVDNEETSTTPTIENLQSTESTNDSQMQLSSSTIEYPSGLDLFKEDEDTIRSSFKERTLICKSIKASSVDFTSQDIEKTRDARNTRSFWSSTGSKDNKANEFLIYQLQDPWFVVERERKLQKAKSVKKWTEFYKYVDVINTKEGKSDDTTDHDESVMSFDSQIGVLFLEKFTLKPFLASWQNNNCYAPKQVSLSVAKISPTTKLEDLKFETLDNLEYPVQNTNEFHQFEAGPFIILYKRDNNIDLPPTEKTTTEETVRSETTRNDDEDDEDEGIEVENEDEEAEEGQNQDNGATTRIVITDDDLLHALSLSGGAINDDFYRELRRIAERKLIEKRREVEENMLFQQLSAREEGNILVRFNLLGKGQTQPTDNLYYTCLEFVDLSGSAFVL
ncbi:hypothetical protein C9374_014116 [Naegleria lovaniensis]|uniref:F-box domain-containing protein n=1 Tax=Naegleria lovaniensis TaxID=51637 RepID=A0AA88H0P5_NAELO|nr:uncharacterized protein C9374_014116 [Naegleria lovaniensis]KAG2389556.1 hypothetical protein C9374_014116 [Naegleria lovaniensis]